MKKWLLIVFISLPFVANTQTITTIAGNGIRGSTGDGGQADSAEISPYDCAVDSHGNLYFTTASGGAGCWIRKVTPCGIITSVAGTGVCGYNGDSILATTAKVNNPIGIAFDSYDTLFFAEEFNNRVRKVDAVTGLISTVAGNGTAGFGGDGGAASVAMLNEPGDICFDHSGNLYIEDNGNYRIRKINTSGIISTIVGNGTGGYSGDGGPADSAEISDNYGICADTNGNIIFGQDYWFRLRKVNVSDTIAFMAGNGSSGPSGDGGLANTAGIEFFGVVYDRFGNLYISGWHDNDIRKITDSGIIYTVAGNGISGFGGDGGPADSAELDAPYGIAVDAYGNLYIADAGNNRIRKVTLNPVIAPAATITSTADTVCSGTAVTFTATVTGSSAPFTYQWLVNGIVAGGTNNIYTYTPANGDSIRCVLSVNGLCATPSSNTIYIVVIPTTIPSITLTSAPVSTIGSIVTVNAIVAGAGSSYNINWYDNGVLFNTTTTPIVTYTKTVNTDVVTATVIPMSVGCYDSTLSAAITITDSSTASPLPSPGERVSIYPNPAATEITIKAANKISEITITNVLGQIVASPRPSPGERELLRIDVSGLPMGVYFVKVTDSEGWKTATKIVKQ